MWFKIPGNSITPWVEHTERRCTIDALYMNNRIELVCICRRIALVFYGTGRVPQNELPTRIRRRTTLLFFRESNAAELSSIPTISDL